MCSTKVVPVLLALCLAGSALESHAASYLVPSDAVLIRKAGVVLRGQVLDVVSAQDPLGGIHTDATLSVDRVLKGSIDAPVVTVRQPGGTVDDRSEFYPGIGTFTPGEKVLLMLTPIADGLFRVTDFALGNFTVLHAPDGSEFIRREGLRDSFLLQSLGEPDAIIVSPSGSPPDHSGTDPNHLDTEPDRDAHGFERYVTALGLGLLPPVDYLLPEQPPADSDRIAGFVFLGTPPARLSQFDTGGTVTYTDNASGDAGSLCQPGGCHSQVDTGMLKWNSVPGTKIFLAYGGPDAGVGNRCLSALDNQIQFNDPCNEIDDLSGCTGLLALGGFTSSGASGGSPPCAAMDNPSFGKILNGKILVNNGTGSCLDDCDYTEMIAHETGHTLGAGHTPDNLALMHATLNRGLCGNPRPDDAAFAQCVYPLTSCAGPELLSATAKHATDGRFKVIIVGRKFKKGAVVQIDSGSGFVDAPITRFKSSRKLLGMDIAAIWPQGTPVQVLVVNPDACPSNSFPATR